MIEEAITRIIYFFMKNRTLLILNRFLIFHFSAGNTKNFTYQDIWAWSSVADFIFTSLCFSIFPNNVILIKKCFKPNPTLWYRVGIFFESTKVLRIWYSVYKHNQNLILPLVVHKTCWMLFFQLLHLENLAWILISTKPFNDTLYLVGLRLELLWYDVPLPSLSNIIFSLLFHCLWLCHIVLKNFQSLNVGCSSAFWRLLLP